MESILFWTSQWEIPKKKTFEPEKKSFRPINENSTMEVKSAVKNIL